MSAELEAKVAELRAELERIRRIPQEVRCEASPHSASVAPGWYSGWGQACGEIARRISEDSP